MCEPILIAFVDAAAHSSASSLQIHDQVSLLSIRKGQWKEVEANETTVLADCLMLAASSYS